MAATAPSSMSQPLPQCPQSLNRRLSFRRAKYVARLRVMDVADFYEILAKYGVMEGAKNSLRRDIFTL